LHLQKNSGVAELSLRENANNLSTLYVFGGFLNGFLGVVLRDWDDVGPNQSEDWA
jgi:hypothetical protein